MRTILALLLSTTLASAEHIDHNKFHVPSIEADGNCRVFSEHGNNPVELKFAPGHPATVGSLNGETVDITQQAFDRKGKKWYRVVTNDETTSEGFSEIIQDGKTTYEGVSEIIKGRKYTEGWVPSRQVSCHLHA
jgi:hypothetical protein